MAIYNLPTVREMKQGYRALVARVDALEGKAGSPQAPKPAEPQTRREAVQDTSQIRKAVSDGKGNGTK